MATGGLSLSLLTEEFQEAKKRLKEVEDGIQKHTGRPSSLQHRLKPRLDAPAGLRRQLASRLDDGPLRRHQGGAFSRLGRQLNANEVQKMGPNPSALFSRKRERVVEPKVEEIEEAEEEPPRKMGLMSSIGASSVTVKGKSRTELLNEQSNDTSVKERNRRMFGMILGTLKSFEKEETTKRKEQVNKKVEKEQKVEDMKQKEKEDDIRHRRELLTEKREKLVQLKKLQSKMEVVGAFEEFSKRHKFMSNFIHTAAKPPIMWLPKLHTKATENILAKSKAKIHAIIEKEEERMLLEVERIEGITRASDGEPDEKENSNVVSSVAVVVKNETVDQSIEPVNLPSAPENGKNEPERESIEAGYRNITIVIENVQPIAEKDEEDDNEQSSRTQSPPEKIVNSEENSQSTSKSAEGVSNQNERASRSPARSSKKSRSSSSSSGSSSNKSSSGSSKKSAKSSSEAEDGVPGRSHSSSSSASSSSHSPVSKKQAAAADVAAVAAPTSSPKLKHSSSKRRPNSQSPKRRSPVARKRRSSTPRKRSSTPRGELKSQVHHGKDLAAQTEEI